jgi:hypothetical protein
MLQYILVDEKVRLSLIVSCNKVLVTQFHTNMVGWQGMIRKCKRHRVQINNNHVYKWHIKNIGSI